MSNQIPVIPVVLSRSGEQFLCSCPTLLPSYVVRHSCPDSAKQLMRHVLDHILNGQRLIVPEKARVQLSEFFESTSGEFYLAECPGLLPGCKTFGNTGPKAVQGLNYLISDYFSTPFWDQTISVKRSGSFYHANCQSVLPDVLNNCISEEESYNEMAKAVTDHLIRETLKKQASSPIIVTGSFHSGTSALTLLLMRNGVSMGSRLNYAYDEQDISNGIPEVGPFMGLPSLIEHYYPDKQNSIPTNELLLLQDYFFRLVQSKILFPYWGWKAPVATFLMPLLGQVFPKAKFLHIIRDGRDVALSPHPTFPNNEFGKLLYFDRTDIEEWEGIKLTSNLGANMASNRFDPPPSVTECELLAYLWEKMSILGAEYGSALGNRYLQVRFEKLCLHPEETVAEISEFLGILLNHEVMEWKKDRVGKFKRPPEWASQVGFIETLEKRCLRGLDFLGYAVDD